MNPEDERFLSAAIDLAGRGRFRVEPNPLVGAVLVKDGNVVGEGWHAKYGGLHAEPAAIRDAVQRYNSGKRDDSGEATKGATLYVSLEPCSHEGKTPPCTTAILEAGIRRVVYAAPDPNHKTAGQGPAILEEAGLEVSGGFMGKEARKLNARYVAHFATSLPWTIAKWAMTLDGKIADVRGGSRYVTGEESRRLVHEIRGAVDAVVVGSGTVLMDDPDLRARDVETTRQAVRVILDTELSLTTHVAVIRSARERPTWFIAAQGVPEKKRLPFLEAGCQVITVPRDERGVDVEQAFRKLRKRGIERVLLEGGGKMHASALRAGVVSQVMAFLAPKIVGGRDAPTPVDGPGVRNIREALALSEQRVETIGPDVLVEGYLRGYSSGRVP